MHANNFTRVEATHAAEKVFVERVHEIYATHLWSRAKSWYNGANIPGKVVESLNFTGGLPLYMKLCNECAEKGYEGFTFSKLSGEQQDRKSSSGSGSEG